MFKKLMLSIGLIFTLTSLCLAQTQTHIQIKQMTINKAQQANMQKNLCGTAYTVTHQNCTSVNILAGQCVLAGATQAQMNTGYTMINAGILFMNTADQQKTTADLATTNGNNLWNQGEGFWFNGNWDNACVKYSAACERYDIAIPAYANDAIQNYTLANTSFSNTTNYFNMLLNQLNR